MTRDDSDLSQKRKQVSELSRFIQTLSARINTLVSDLVRTPTLPDDQSKTILLWRILLLAISADVGFSIHRLAEHPAEDHARAMRMLDRSLFEYGLRMEIYVFYPEVAVRHAQNLSAWWAILVKASQQFMDFASLTREERHYFSEVIRNMDDLEYPAIEYMLRHCLAKNGYKGGERKRRQQWLLGNYYHIGSALIHGSQGAFYDFFANNPQTNGFAFTPKSVRHPLGKTLLNSAIHLIGTISSEEKHRRRYLGTDMYYRDLEFITGRWEFVHTTRPRLNT